MSALGKISITGFGLIALVFAVAAPIPQQPNEAQAFGYRIGELLAMIAIPFLIAWAIAGRRSARKPNLFAGLFCGIGFLLLFANAGSLLGSINPETTDQKAARLMREAAGLQPVHRSIFGEDKTDTKLRELFRQVIRANQEYQEGVDKLDLSATSKLSTPESFADPDSAAEALRQLHAAYDLDSQQEQRMQQILDGFKSSLDDLPSSERDSMLNGFNQGLAKVMPARQRAVSTEKAWVDSLDDLYGYAREHHDEFSLSDGRLTIRSDRTLEGFNSRIETMNRNRNQFLKAKNDFAAMQGQSLQRMGISRQQTGLH